MFNDKYGLTQAVLEGRKTQTRRIVSESLVDDYDYWLYDVMCIAVQSGTTTTYEEVEDFLIKRSKYAVGEVVAIAQRYKDIFSEFSQHPNPQLNICVKNPTDTAGWTNKMFTKAELMPHQIRITDVRVERLQDISDECCLKEGIIKKWHAPACKNYYYVPGVEVKSVKDVHDTPQEAFAHLINKVSRKDVWIENPYVFVYDFELVDRINMNMNGIGRRNNKKNTKG